MAAEKERTLLSTEKLETKDELKQLADELNKLIQSDEWKEKLAKNLDQWVSEILKKNWIVWQIQEVYRSQENPQAREWLQRLLKLAKVDDAVRDEQREINVRLEAIKEQESLSEEVRSDTGKLKEAVKSQIESRITQLLSKGDFQWALDNAVYLLSAEDKSSAFSIVKYILKRTPASETLYIKDKKITYSKRMEWIKKMEDNMEAASREFQSTYYQEASVTDEWTLWEKSDKHSDKKAAKLLDKELTWNKDLYKISKRINVPSAWELIEKNLQDLKDILNTSLNSNPDAESVEKAFKAELQKDFFLSRWYLPKSWKVDDLGRKELDALTDLCAYRMFAESDPSAKSSYEALISSQVVWATTGELEQARKVLGQVEVGSLTHERAKETLMALLWDLNWDGRVTNTSMKEGADRKWLDKWTLFWGQVLNMFDTAVKRFWEEKVIKNIESIIKGLSWLDGFKVESATIEGLIAEFKKNPSALIAFRNKLMNEPDAWNWMFNAGTEYVTTRIEALNRQEWFRKSLVDFFDNTEEWKAAMEAMITGKDGINEAVEEEIETKALPTLKKYKESPDYKKLTAGQQQQIDKVIDQWSTEEWRKNFLNTPAVKDMYKNFVISWVWLSFTDVSVDGHHVVWAWVWTSVMNEKLNAWLKDNTKNIVSKASASVGMYCADGNVSIGLWLGFWSSTNLSENVRAYYNVNAISWSPFNPKWLSFWAVVWTEARVNPRADDSLDGKSAQYIWVAWAYGFWLDLCNSDLNSHNVSLSAYWRRDKLEGVERKAEKVREKMAPIFQHLFEIDWEVTVQSIMENLRGWKMNNGTEFNWFARTSWDTLYRTATAIFNMFNSYKGRLSAENPNKEAIIQKISENFADNLAREMRNKDIERIVDEWLHLSWANIGVSWSFARLFTGFFLSWGLTFTYYEDSEYRENPAMLEQAQRGMENSDNFDVIRTGSYTEKMNTMNEILWGQYLRYHESVTIKTLPELWGWRVPAHITLSKEIFWKDIKVLCHPELAPYIIQENWEIKLPGNADVSLAQIRHQWKVENTLILGAKSSSGCEAISLDGDNLKWEWNSTVEFGSKKEEFEKYNTEIKTKTESMKVWIDWKPNDDLKKYLEDNWDALVKFRLANIDYKKFVAAVQSDSMRGENFVENTIKYLPEDLKNLVTKWTDDESKKQAIDDIRFIYASLSRVSQTRDKQLVGPDLKKKADEYLNWLKLSAENKASLESYITKVEGGAVLSDEEWTKMKWILGINYNNWEYRTSNSAAERLFHILTPVKKLAEHRTASYERRIKSEYSKLWWGADVLIAARNAALERLSNTHTAKGDLKEWWIGAVAGYEDRTSITDKFVSSPKIISWSEALIPDSENLNIVKKHFLSELSRDDSAQFRAIKEKIILTLEKSKKQEDNQLAQNWKNLHDAEFIDAILTTKTKNEKWEDVLQVSFNMQYGFFADCVNETILLGDVNVITTTEEQIQAPHDVNYYDATVTNDAVTIGHSFSIWATVGKVKSRELDNPESPEEPEEPKDETEPVETPTWSTEPFVDIDALGNATEVDFDNKQMEYWGQSYHLFNKTIDGNKCVIAVNEATREKFMVVKNPSWWVDFVPCDWKTWPSVLSNATEVAMKNHEEFLKKHKEWEAKHNDYLVKHAEWEKKHAEWEKVQWKINESQEAYLKRHEEIIKALPEAKQTIARDILILNYQIQHAKPWESADLIRKRDELKQRIDATIIDRIVQ